MAGRIRTIKPELREHLQFAQLTDKAARLFVMLYTLVDDEGRCPASPAYLAGNVFFARPCAPTAIGKAIAELEAAGLVKPYAVNGAPFLEIAGWRLQGAVTHQRIEKPQPARYPAPESIHSRTDSGNGSRTDSGTDLYLDQDHRPGPPTTDQDRDATEPPGSRRRPETSAVALHLSKLLHELIATQSPSSKIGKHSEAAKTKTIATWAVDIERLHRADGIEPEHIERVIRWCQGDSFWRSNILSGRKLREKYDTLELQRTRARGDGPAHVGRATPASADRHAADAAAGAASW